MNDEFVKQYDGLVRWVTMRTCGLSNPNFEDYVQDSWVKLASVVDKFNPKKGKMTTFIVAVLSRHVQRLMWREHGLKGVPKGFLPLRRSVHNNMPMKEPKEESSDFWFEVSKHMNAKELELVRRWVGGATFDVLAGELNVTRQRVQQIVSRAIERLDGVELC